MAVEGWSEEEDKLVRDTLHLSAQDTVARLSEAGYRRSYGAVRNRRSRLAREIDIGDNRTAHPVLTRIGQAVREQERVFEEIRSLQVTISTTNERLESLREQQRTLNEEIAQLSRQLIEQS